MRAICKQLGVAYAAAALCLVSPALADSIGDCFSEASTRRIEACSEIIASPGLDGGAKSLAYATRALAYSLKGTFDPALSDYDQAIRLDPGSAIALNNRAWVLFKLKRPNEALDDVERSLSLSPASPHAHDTRAHVQQALGKGSKALEDYERAMRLGGEHLIKLYQCGLQSQGLFSGRIDGFYRKEMRHAFETCVGSVTCDPLPADEECRNATS